jgi:O-antigen ligase
VVGTKTVWLDVKPPQREGLSNRPRKQVALCLLLIAAAFPLRFIIGGGRTGSVFDLAVLAMLIPLLAYAVRFHRLYLPPSGVVVGITIPAAVALLSLIWTQDFAATSLEIASYLESLVVVVFCVTMLHNDEPQVIVRWIARFGLLLLLAPILMYLHVRGFEPPAGIDRLSGDYLSYYVRFSHPFIGRSNNIATLLAILWLPLIYWSVTYRRNRLATSLIGVALVLTLSRGVLLGVAIGGLLLAVRTRGQFGALLRRLVTPLVIGAVALLIIVLNDPMVAETIGGRLTSVTVGDRANLLTLGVQAINQNPLIGIGGGVGEPVHNSYLQQIVYYGFFLGSLVVLAFLRVPAAFFGRDVLSRAAGLGVAAAFVSFLSESSLEGTLLRPLIFLCIGLLAALSLSVERFGWSVPSSDPGSDGT